MSDSALATIYPTHVGMNRNEGNDPGNADHLPHTCGDEPETKAVAVKTPYIYPTHVGMNRHFQTVFLAHNVSTPHMWG